jgi:TolB-like protein
VEHGRVLRFGRFEFAPDTGELRGPVSRLRLRPQSGRVLALLAERPGELVTRDEIRRAVWNESTHVEFEQALDNAIWQIRTALGDTTHPPQFVETLPRRGYRFVAPVSECTADMRAVSPGADTAAEVLTLAVLPLEPLSDEPDTRSFAAGMTDELVTILAQRHEVRLVSLESTAAAAGPRRALGETARELHASLVMDGGVLLSEERVRVNVRLVDAGTDAHIWAHSYEKERGEPLALQRRIAALVVEGLVATIAGRGGPTSAGGRSGAVSAS